MRGAWGPVLQTGLSPQAPWAPCVICPPPRLSARGPGQPDPAGTLSLVPGPKDLGAPRPLHALGRQRSHPALPVQTEPAEPSAPHLSPA